MKRNLGRKLLLSTESLRRLDRKELGRVLGGTNETDFDCLPDDSRSTRCCLPDDSRSTRCCC
jgi:hypothetical protein